MSERENSWFHLHEGWYFRRKEKGGIEIGRGADRSGIEVVFETDATGWASLVAHLGSPSLTLGERYEQAIKLHTHDIPFWER